MDAHTFRNENEKYTKEAIKDLEGELKRLENEQEADREEKARLKNLIENSDKENSNKNDNVLIPNIEKGTHSLPDKERERERERERESRIRTISSTTSPPTTFNPLLSLITN